MRDRVVQMAALLILEPIFEADFLDCSYGFRPGRNRAPGAGGDPRAYRRPGYQAVYDADLKSYFDTIPHERLMACLRMRVVDRSVLKLIRMWLEAKVVDSEAADGQHPSVQRVQAGTPQGGVISPLLSNIYLHRFDRSFYHLQGPAQRAGAKLVRYADDFVVLARHVTPRLTQWIGSWLSGFFATASSWRAAISRTSGWLPPRPAGSGHAGAVPAAGRRPCRSGPCWHRRRRPATGPPRPRRCARSGR